MGFGHRVYRAEDPRAARAAPHRARDRLASASRSPRRSRRRRWPSCKARKPDRVLATNVEFWSAVVLDHADVPPTLFTQHVHLRAHGRLVGAHPRAEARGAADPPDGEVRRARAARAAQRCSPAPTARAQDVAQDRRVLLGERGDLRRRRAGAPPHLLAHAPRRAGSARRSSRAGRARPGGARPGRRPRAGRRSRSRWSCRTAARRPARSSAAARRARGGRAPSPAGTRARARRRPPSAAACRRGRSRQKSAHASCGR